MKFPTRLTLPQNHATPARRAAFTLVELLTVIAIIAILASLTMVTVIEVIKAAKKAKAKLEIHDLAGAIESYDADYAHFPVSKPLQDTLQAMKWTGDYTYGGSLILAQPAIPNYALFSTNNSEVIAILTDVTNYPSTSQPTANIGHVKNSRQKQYLAPHYSGDTSSPGVGIDLIYRDPWGNPYIISLDLNYSEQCQDAFYCLDLVSGNNQTRNNPGLNGLFNPDTSKNNNFQFHRKVMVWSAGPDGKIDPAQPANTGVNKDNILSWQ